MLGAIGKLYGFVANVRNTLYDRGVFKSYPLGARTISIGNITTGGTGKTPVVAYVANILAESGEKVCILTRGYGRQNPRDRVLVSDGTNVLVDALTGGDEPVELARKLIGKAIVVADANRVSAAEWAKENFGITAFVLDDGFQHRRAKRDLDIVCIDATNPFGGSRMLPAGTLREPPKNLARANAVIITRSDLVNIRVKRLLESLTLLGEFVPTTKDELKQWHEKADQFRTDHVFGLFQYVPHDFWHYLSDADIGMKDEAFTEVQQHRLNLLVEALNQWLDEIKKDIHTNAPSTRIFAAGNEIVGVRSLDEFQNSENGSKGDDELSVLAFCALGNPKAFFDQLSIAQFDLALTHTFPDHHHYTRSDISMLDEKAKGAGVQALLTTAKDAVKLDGLRFKLPCYVVDVKVKLDDPDAFRDLVLSS